MTPRTDEFAESDVVLDAIEVHHLALERIRAWAAFARRLESEMTELTGLLKWAVRVQKSAECMPIQAAAFAQLAAMAADTLSMVGANESSQNIRYEISIPYSSGERRKNEFGEIYYGSKADEQS